MTLPDSGTPLTWQLEDIVSALVSQSFPFLSGHGSPTHYPDTSPHSATSHVDFDAVSVMDHPSAFLASDLSHNLNDFDATFTPENLAQDGHQWISSYGSTVLTEEPVSTYISFCSSPVLTISKGGDQHSAN